MDPFLSHLTLQVRRHRYHDLFDPHPPPSHTFASSGMGDKIGYVKQYFQIAFREKKKKQGEDR
jgi:hypothetical protein